MTKAEHRVGSITFGISLISFGILYLLSMFWDDLPCALVIKLWPCVLILLGTEVLLANTRYRASFRVDAAAIIMTVFILFSAMGMAGLQLVLSKGALLLESLPPSAG